MPVAHRCDRLTQAAVWQNRHNVAQATIAPHHDPVLSPQVTVDRRLFFREQAKRMTIGIVSGEPSRPSTAEEAQAVAAVVQDAD